MNDLEKQFITALKSIGSDRRLDRVFFDFVAIAAASIARIDRPQADKHEQLRVETLARYTEEEGKVFARCFDLLVEIMGTGFGDHLGQLYMNLDLGNDRLGQYFSPYDLSLLSARMILDESSVAQKIEEKGFVSLYEPTVGGGGMVIAAAQVVKDMGFNPQQQLHVTCQDLDITAVYMTYLQLSLFGIPAVVIHGDVLKLEERSHWYTPFHIINGWSRKLERGYLLKPKEREPEYEELIAKCEELTTPLPEQPQPAPQLVLF